VAASAWQVPKCSASSGSPRREQLDLGLGHRRGLDLDILPLPQGKVSLPAIQILSVAHTSEIFSVHRPNRNLAPASLSSVRRPRDRTRPQLSQMERSQSAGVSELPFQNRGEARWRFPLSVAMSAWRSVEGPVRNAVIRLRGEGPEIRGITFLAQRLGPDGLGYAAYSACRPKQNHPASHWTERVNCLMVK